jgi:hypothetical protein
LLNLHYIDRKFDSRPQEGEGIEGLGRLVVVGHAEGWDKTELDGQLDGNTRSCTITYTRSGRKLAAAFVHRDLEGLRAEVEFERATRGATS